MTWDLTEPSEPNFDADYWTTKDGKQLLIREMETSHIKNTIKMLKKKLKNMDREYKNFYGDYFDFKIEEFETELKVRNVYRKHIMEVNNE